MFPRPRDICFWARYICIQSFKYSQRDCMCNFKWASMQSWQCPCKAFTDQVLIRNKCFVSVNFLFLFAVSLRWLAHSLLIKSNGETSRNKHISSKKEDSIFHIFYQIIVSRVPFTYAYNPFKRIVHLFRNTYNIPNFGLGNTHRYLHLNDFSENQNY